MSRSITIRTGLRFGHMKLFPSHLHDICALQAQYTIHMTSCVSSLCMLCKYCWFSTACPINRLWGSKGRGSDRAPEHYRIVSDQDAVLPVACVKGYVWHWYNTIFKTIAGVTVLTLLNLSLWANTCDSRLTCITRCLYRAPRVAKLSLVCGMSYLK